MGRGHGLTPRPDTIPASFEVYFEEYDSTVASNMGSTNCITAAGAVSSVQGFWQGILGRTMKRSHPRAWGGEIVKGDIGEQQLNSRSLCICIRVSYLSIYLWAT